MIAVDPETNGVLSYGSASFTPRHRIPDVGCGVTVGGHMIVAPGHERRALTPLTGVCVGVYGHRLVDLGSNLLDDTRMYL